MRTRWRVIVLLAWLVATVTAFLLLAWLFQRRLIYFPLPAATPSASGVLPGAEEVVLRTSDGLELGAWWVPPSDASAPRATVLVFNGNAGNRSFRAPLAEALRREGFATLLFDYRGYGGNPGSPSEVGLAEDARAAQRLLEARGSEATGPIVYFGESLGSAVAIALAVERPPAALILRSPFPSLADVGRVHYPILPVRLLLRDRFDAIGKAPFLRCPVLVIVGERDGIVPPGQSRLLYEAISSPERELFVVAGADHNDWELLAGAGMVGSIRRFLGRTLETPSP